LLVAGANSIPGGQIGQGDVPHVPTFSSVSEGATGDVRIVSAGTYHSVFHKRTVVGGNIWTAGKIENLTDDHKTFTQLVDVTDIFDIAAGGRSVFYINHTAGRMLSGKGENLYGQLGLGDVLQKPSFTNINQFLVYTVSAGNDVTLMIQTQKPNDAIGTVWSVGNNRHGQLGYGWKGNINISDFRQISSLGDRVCAIAANSNHNFAQKDDGTIYSVGDNSKGQLGLDDTTDRYEFTQVPGFRMWNPAP
jgi:alpha-tubulin suppressor-like RCC1 family protein